MKDIIDRERLLNKIDVRAEMIPYEKGNQLAFGTLIIDQAFQINHVRLMKREQDGEPFLAFPARKNAEGKYENLCFLNDKDCYEACLKEALCGYLLRKSAEQREDTGQFLVKVTICEKDSLLGLATVETGYFTMRGVRIMKGPEGAFVALPARKMEDGAYGEIYHPVNKEVRNNLTKAVLTKYEEAKKESLQKEQDAKEKKPPGQEEPEKQPERSNKKPKSPAR